MLILRLQDCDEDTEPHIRRNGGEVNILVDNGMLFESDLELFFGPLEDWETFIVVEPGTLWSHILAGLGCFPSIGQARKNGWNKAIEEGFTPTFKVGKAARKFFTAFRPTDENGGTGLKFVLGKSEE